MPNDKLDIDALTLDDVLGEGVETSAESEDLELDENLQEVEDTEDIEIDDVEEEDEEFDDVFEDDDYDEEEVQDEEFDDEEEEDFESESVAYEIAKTLGFELENDYEDSVEGLTELVREISQSTAEEQLNNLFAQFPEIQQHLDYVLAGGDSREFFQRQGSQIDYNSIDISENNVNMQRAIVGQYLQTKGLDPEIIQDTLDTYEESGKLFGNAQKAKNHLVTLQREEQQNLLERQKQEYAVQQEQLQSFWNDVADTIESGNEFAGVRIPDREKSKFFDYISSPIGPNGETQRDLDYQDAGVEVKLAIDYMMYSGFDLAGIIDTKARTKAARNLRERIVSNEEHVKNARRQQRTSKSTNIDDIDFERLI